MNEKKGGQVMKTSAVQESSESAAVRKEKVVYVDEEPIS